MTDLLTPTNVGAFLAFIFLMWRLQVRDRQKFREVAEMTADEIRAQAIRSLPKQIAFVVVSGLGIACASITANHLIDTFDLTLDSLDEMLSENVVAVLAGGGQRAFVWPAPAAPTVNVSAALDTAANVTSSPFAAGDSSGFDDLYAYTNWYIDTVTTSPGTGGVWTALRSDSTDSYAKAGASNPLPSGATFIIVAEHCGVKGGCSDLSAPDTFTTTLGVPSTPTLSVSPTDSSAVATLSPFSGGTHDSTQIQFDTVTASPLTIDSVSGAQEKDTIFGLATGAELAFRGRYKDNSAGWSGWSETDTVTISEPAIDTAGMYPSAPSNWTLSANLLSWEPGDKINWDGWDNNSGAWTGTNPGGGPPTSVADATCPIGGDAVEFRTEDGDNGDGANKFRFSNSVYNALASGADSIYVAFFLWRDYYDYNNASGNARKKYFYVAHEANGATNYFSSGSHQTTDGGGLRFNSENAGQIIYYNSGISPAYNSGLAGDGTVAVDSAWTRMEFLLTAESSSAAGDGGLRIYTSHADDSYASVDTLFQADTIQHTGAGEGPEMHFIQWYHWQNTPPGTPERLVKLCGIRVMGAGA